VFAAALPEPHSEVRGCAGSGELITLPHRAEAPARRSGAGAADEGEESPKRPGNYRPWAELLKRTFGVDVLQCPKCKGPMKLIAMLTETKSVARYLAGIGELTDVPGRSPSRGPPSWKSVVLRKKAPREAA
jgi:hypothetical protein